jgi:RimJ/RimL family protein N-acetyltransferase
MRHFPAPLTRTESDAFVDRLGAHVSEHGWGLWAVEAPEGFVGFTGLWPPEFDVPGEQPPVLEVGWRLARRSWGRGYATEAAGEVLAYAFGPLRLRRVVSFTAVENTRSQAVMRRLALHHVRDFDHPALPEGHRLRRHVLYAADASGWIRPPAGR